MPKKIKEFLLDQATGSVATEFDDDSVSSFNLSNSLSLSPARLTKGGVALTSSERAAVRAGIGLSGSFAPGLAYGPWAEFSEAFLAEIALAESGVGHIAVLGDSTAAGTGSSDVDVHSIPAKIRRSLIGIGVSASEGMVPQYRESASSGQWTGVDWSDFGRTTNLMQGSTARTFTSDGAGTVVTVLYGNSGASFDVAIDGGSAVRVTTTGAGAFATYQVTDLGNTTHAVVITPVSGSSHIYAVEVRPENCVKISNFGIGGSTSAEISSVAAWFHTLRAVVYSGVKVALIRGAVNDIGASVATATTVANMLSSMNFLRDNGIDVALLTPCFYENNDDDVSVQAGALIDAAVSDGFAVFDSSEFYGGFAKAMATGLMTDAVHPGDVGYAKETRTILSLVGAF